MTFHHNLSFQEIVVTYIVMMIIGIVAGLMASPVLFIITIGLFLRGILGYCVVYEMLGINHCPED